MLVTAAHLLLENKALFLFLLSSFSVQKQKQVIENQGAGGAWDVPL